MSHCTDWNLIHSDSCGVSAWYSQSTGWIAIGLSPNWADSWIIGRPQRWFDNPHWIDRLIQEWIANHP